MHDAKGCCLHARHGQTANGDIGILFHMLLQHDLVVHFVDVIARENDDVVDAVAVDNIYVLCDGISGAKIPVFIIHPLAGGQDIKEFVPLCTQEAPAALTVSNKAMRLVLGRNRHLPNAGIQRVGESKIDDPRFTAKVDGRFGAIVGELF